MKKPTRSLRDHTDPRIRIYALFFIITGTVLGAVGAFVPWWFEGAIGVFLVAGSTIFFTLEVRTRLKMRTRKASKRPGIAPKGLLVDWLMPPNQAEEALFNILGRYDYWVAKHGDRWARIIFLTQCLGTVISFWVDWLLRRVKLLEILRRS